MLLLHDCTVKLTEAESTSVLRGERIGWCIGVKSDSGNIAVLLHTEAFHREAQRTPVLLVISLSGVKVCSPDGKKVFMAHALKRISYATSEAEHLQFAFVAREPHDPNNRQFCHTFVTQSPQQAEELNHIVGSAFRMAYAAQLQKQKSGGSTSSSSTDETWNRRGNNNEPAQKPTSIPGLITNMGVNVFQPSPTSSEEDNVSTISPTEVNTCRLLPVKPEHTKVLASPLLANPSSPSSTDSFSLVNFRPSGGTASGLSSDGYENDKSKSVPSTTSGLTNSSSSWSSTTTTTTTQSHAEIYSHSDRPLPPPPPPLPPPPSNQAPKRHRSCDARTPRIMSLSHEKTARVSSVSPLRNSRSVGKGKGRSILATLRDAANHKNKNNPPPLPQRTDSLPNTEEEKILRTASWFQAGIPREIALEVLNQEPVGSFLVRQSTSKPGCYALSLRVPRDFQPTGIAHYLVLKTQRGYKIKGFTKEFPTLTSLIIHHSVMPELLPCPLLLSKQTNPGFHHSDSSDFADIDSDPDYNTLSDFRRKMADLNV